ncbi:hypothetical protein BDP27DRAFT_1443746 [Rhodocollybia butyracea]|uniref:Uncharacterized protein n=1 Tax=Rhodocollybia butyracea TaxID=206335 RepID=A0A9P5Q6H4_9AGAR|nr:hypothetical protein BDP27DRAFT_1443746 [Rhodocollybia butyracea]
MGHLPVKFVVAGTVIPPEHFQSKIGEWDDFRWCSDTGSFDNPDVQRQYISQFLPPDLRNSDNGRILLDRMWPSYLTILLNNNFESPHTLLGDYIQRIAGYVPPDNHEFSRGEKVCHNQWYSSLGSRGLDNKSTSMIGMHRAVINFLTTSEGCFDCSTKDRALVTQDYGYFVDTECSQIALDEPMTILYGAGWFRDRKSNYGIGSLIQLITNLRLHASDAFTISGSLTPLSKAKLVTFNTAGEATDVHFSGNIPRRLVWTAKTPLEMLAWFKHECDEPFCVLSFPFSERVALVFCLQTPDARCFWVFVGVPSKFLVENPDFAQDVDYLQPHKLFKDQPEILSVLDELPNPYLDVGALAILRVSGSYRVKTALKIIFPSGQLPATLY